MQSGRHEICSKHALVPVTRFQLSSCHCHPTNKAVLAFTTEMLVMLLIIKLKIGMKYSFWFRIWLPTFYLFFNIYDFIIYKFLDEWLNFSMSLAKREREREICIYIYIYWWFNFSLIYLIDNDRTSFDNQTVKKVGEWTNGKNTSMVLAKGRSMIKVKKVKRFT